MEFIGLEKINEGKFVTRYDLKYKTQSGNIKNYEMISRNKNLNSFEQLKQEKSDAVIMIVHDVTGEKILLNKEFRMAVGTSVYNFPAGLIDPGEDFKVAAKRELWEETGLEMIEVKETWPMSYSAVGPSNETGIVVVATAKGDFKPSTSDEEEIEAGWYTKEEVAELIKTQKFAARTQCYCIMWAKS